MNIRRLCKIRFEFVSLISTICQILGDIILRIIKKINSRNLKQLIPMLNIQYAYSLEYANFVEWNASKSIAVNFLKDLKPLSTEKNYSSII